MLDDEIHRASERVVNAIRLDLSILSFPFNLDGSKGDIILLKAAWNVHSFMSKNPAVNGLAAFR